MKPWSEAVSQRDERDKPENDTWPMRFVAGICVCTITSNPNDLYLKASKYGIGWCSHAGILADKIVRHENLLSGLPICGHCEGTGNEMYSMYRQCPKCNGRGVIVEAQG